MKRFCLFLIRCYQLEVSPYLFPRCRFYPSCSHYAQLAIRANGVWWGLLYTLKRLLRCHPFANGGVDFPPAGSSR